MLPLRLATQPLCLKSPGAQAQPAPYPKCAWLCACPACPASTIECWWSGSGQCPLFRRAVCAWHCGGWGERGWLEAGGWGSRALLLLLYAGAFSGVPPVEGAGWAWSLSWKGGHGTLLLPGQAKPSQASHPRPPVTLGKRLEATIHDYISLLLQLFMVGKD